MVSENTLTEIQQDVDSWIKEHGGYWPPLSMLVSVVEEVGELSREINHLEGFKPKKPSENPGDLELELGDLVFSMICIANHYKINLNMSIQKVLTKYSLRDSDRYNKK